MKEIKATAPTPQDWIELVRDNERLGVSLNVAIRSMDEMSLERYIETMDELENKTND